MNTKKLTIGFLGPLGTWSHQAALACFKEAQFVDLPSFNAIFDCVQSGELDFGVLPIENTTQGFVSQTLDPLLTYEDIHICNQSYLNIRHCLLSTSPYESIKTIYSHPQALGQCQKWIHQNFPNAQLVPMPSTAAAAEFITQTKTPNSAVIGNRATAQIYKLPIIQKDIQDDPLNTTRFITIGKQQTSPTGNDRTSIYFCVPHQTGSLFHVLKVFNDYKINLFCLDARPLNGNPWKYVFFTDVEGHQKTEPLKSCLTQLDKIGVEYKVLGSYQQNIPAD